MFCSVVFLFLPTLHTAAPSPPSNVSTVEVISVEAQQMKRDLSELIKVTVCCRTVPASPGASPALPYTLQHYFWSLEAQLSSEMGDLDASWIMGGNNGL